MSGLNEHQRRRIAIGFEQLDRCLAEAWSVVASADHRSPFPKYVADASPAQIRTLEDFISRFRSAVVRILDELDLPREQPRVSALWSLRASLVSAQVLLDELDGRYLRGYGDLDPQDEKRVRGATTELRDLVRKMAALAEERPGEDLVSRLRRLETTRDENRLLQEVGRVIAVHGLVELRPTLSILLERLESKSLEVAVFGRVSSGKSSLLNHLLNTKVLPVGVTPVTAVPIRITFGETARMRVHFARRPILETGVTRLQEFAAEEANPANEKLVTAIRVELSAACLKSGVTLVDTPGLGSLATAGAEETKAYLPRCDLGIVLVDAASNLDREDLDLVRALGQRGTNVMVLVSKVDLLASEDRRRVIEYVERHLDSEVGAKIPVYPVSVVGPDARLAAAWFEKQLFPILEAQREQAEISRRRCFEILDALGSDASEILDEATASIVERLRDSSGADLTEPFRAVWNRRASEVTTSLLRHLTDRSRELARDLGEAAASVGVGADELEELPQPEGAPRPDALLASMRVEIAPPARFLTRIPPYLRRYVRSRLAATAPTVQESLWFHRKELLGWTERVLNEYRRVVDATADRCRLAMEGTSGHVTFAGETAMRADLELLTRDFTPSEAAPSRGTHSWLPEAVPVSERTLEA